MVNTGQSGFGQYHGESGGNFNSNPQVGFSPGVVGGRTEWQSQFRYQRMLYDRMYAEQDIARARRYPLSWLVVYLWIMPYATYGAATYAWLFMGSLWHTSPLMFFLAGAFVFLPIAWLWIRWAFIGIPLIALRRHCVNGGILAPYLTWAGPLNRALGGVFPFR